MSKKQSPCTVCGAPSTSWAEIGRREHRLCDNHYYALIHRAERAGAQVVEHIRVTAVERTTMRQAAPARQSSPLGKLVGLVLAAALLFALVAVMLGGILR